MTGFLHVTGGDLVSVAPELVLASFGALILLLDSGGPLLTDNDLGLTWTDVHVADALRVVHRRDDILFYVFESSSRT